MSCRPSSETSAVAFIRTSQLLVNPGRASRTIWGNVMRMKICSVPMP